MPVIIKCPTCGASVRILPQGFVQEHGPVGHRCSFVRTAHSSGADTSLTPTAKHAKRMAVKAREAAEQKAKRERRAVQSMRVPKPKKPSVECSVCGRKVQLSGVDLQAHQKLTTGRWCKGGKTPTEAQKNKARGKRSVWTVSGGLPGLGRRR